MAVLIRYHEIALKGNNRKRFEDLLIQNIQKHISRSLPLNSPTRFKKIFGRILLQTEMTPPLEATLKKIFGIANFSQITQVPTSFLEIEKAALRDFQKYVEEFGIPKTFKVKTRRSEKVLVDTSMELDRRIGSVLSTEFSSMRVELKNPEALLGIELRRQHSFLWTHKISGPGGLPVGSNAPVLSLISGGIDSPVAAIQILRRGSSSSFVHFDGSPFVSNESLEKVKSLVEVINEYQPNSGKLHIIPFGPIQERIAWSAHPRIRTLLYRRMMIRIAQRLAQDLRACALVTGESLGQVASQTLENLSVIDSVSEMPILRPLIGYDKDEIIAKAQSLGTFATSMQPGTDCCTLFAASHPVLKAEPEWIENAERKLDWEAWINESLESQRIWTSSTPEVDPAEPSFEDPAIFAGRPT